MKIELTRFDRFTRIVAPKWTMKRVRARTALDVLTRNYEAAQSGRRTQGWARNFGDVNAITARALVELRVHARDLRRNNGWAANAAEVITGNTVGWGLVPKAPAGDPSNELWKEWAETTACDAEGLLNFYGLQELALTTVVESGEVLIRRRIRSLKDGLPLPLQLQVLEPDFIDTSKNEETAFGKTVQGVVFDKIGRRRGYWLFKAHPGSGSPDGAISVFVPATEIRHIFRVLRPGQVRGISWYAQSITPLKDFDEYEDAELMRQKVAACFGAFVKDVNGEQNPIGDNSDDDEIEVIEPGHVQYLNEGEDITFSSPPAVADQGFSTRTLRRIAKGMGVTYEDLTGDYSQVNFSSARMARLAHWQNVYKWRHNLLVPQMCEGVWAWFQEAAVLSGRLKTTSKARWIGPPMPMIEPDKEGLALGRLVRNGVMTHDDMILEQGGDPDSHWQEYADGLKKLDDLGIKLDSDVRAVSQAGLTQERAGLAGKGEPPPDQEADLDALQTRLERLLR